MTVHIKDRISGKYCVLLYGGPVLLPVKRLEFSSKFSSKEEAMSAVEQHVNNSKDFVRIDGTRFVLEEIEDGEG